MSFSITLNPEQPASISETELCVRWGRCPRSLLNHRKAGKMPPHFTAPKTYNPQIRYLLSDVEDFEKQNSVKIV